MDPQHSTCLSHLAKPEQWWTGNCSAGDLANHFRPACGAAITRWPFKLLWVRVCYLPQCYASRYLLVLHRIRSMSDLSSHKRYVAKFRLTHFVSTYVYALSLLQGYPGDNRTVLPPDQQTSSYPVASGALAYSVRWTALLPLLHSYFFCFDRICSGQSTAAR